MLFASYWQMQQVASALRSLGFSLLVQGEALRQALLQLHAQQVQHGKRSILFGTQSFSEGLDLPGKLLTNLIITKLPFAVCVAIRRGPHRGNERAWWQCIFTAEYSGYSEKIGAILW
ncbi:ATP-dependent DNA helicase DinG [Alishewanella longhuensis]